MDLDPLQLGLAPHTDTSFLTLLSPNEVPGLSIRTQSGSWIDAPAIPDAYVVNGGQMLQRWTNDFFLATPHRAINRSGGERYALAFFCDSNIDWPIAAVPTTVGPDKPPKYPTTWYSDYMTWYLKRNYDVLNDANLQAAEILDLSGDLQGCLRLLQKVRNLSPESPEATASMKRMGLPSGARKRSAVAATGAVSRPSQAVTRWIPSDVDVRNVLPNSSERRIDCPQLIEHISIVSRPMTA